MKAFTTLPTMVIKKEKIEALHQKMQELGIKEEDLIERFILGSGRGGQNLQKTSSCVYLKHIPTHIEIKCQKERSREANRFFARRELCERIESQLFKEKSAKQKESAKIRKQKQKRSKRQKQKLVEEKRQHSEIKQLRKHPTSFDE